MKRCLTVGVAVCALFCLCASAEVVGTKQRIFAVKYKDGAVERYNVAWTANLTTTLRNESGSFVPYQGAVENRRCSWTIASTIDRTVSLATRLGPTFPLPGMSRTFKSGFQGPDGEILVTGAVNETCKDAGARREDDIRKAKDAVMGSFDRLTEADLDTLKQDVQSRGEVAEIAVQ